MKKKYIILVSIIIFIFILISAYFLLPKKYAVLTYHDFTTGTPQNEMQKNINDFEKEMKYLYKHHYKSLTLKDMECYFDKKCKLPRKSVLITFDDGWKSEYELALPILKKYNLNAVIFYIGSNYEEPNENFISKKEIDDIKKNYPNIEIASHTYQNHIPDAYTKPKEELNKDFEKMNKIIDTKYFAYPYGLYSDSYIETLKDSNYKLAFTFGGETKHKKFSNKDNRYKIPRLNVSTTYSYYKFVLRMVSPF